MVLLSSKKKRYIEDNYSKQLALLAGHLNSSIFKIKSDMKVVRSYLNHLKNQDLILTHKIKSLESQINNFNSLILNFKKSLEIQKPSPFLLEEKNKSQNIQQNYKLLSTLTNTQLDMLQKISQAIQETNQEWIPMKTLTKIFYPNKDYEEVFSTVSEYIKILHELSLVEKKRVSKMVFITLTNQGKLLIDNLKPVSNF